MRKVVTGVWRYAAFTATVAFFWGVTEALFNRFWPPRGTWSPDLLLTSIYNRVIFYAAAAAAALLAAGGIKTIIARFRRSKRGKGRRRWGWPAGVAAVGATNAGWLLIGAMNTNKLRIGGLVLDLRDVGPFFGYWAIFLIIAVALAIVLGYTLGGKRWPLLLGRYLTTVGAVAFFGVIIGRYVSAATRPRAAGPNIVLIVLDAWRADAFRPDLMPKLYSYARENAVVFERTWSCAAWTVPSMTTVFTGQYPDTHGARRGLNADFRSPTIAQVLRDAGYETVALSANRALNRDSPSVDGFEDFYFSGWNGFLQAIHFYETNWYNAAVRGVLHGKRTSEDSRNLTKKLVAYVERPRRRPYFLWVQYLDPHAPYTPPRGYYRPEDEKYIVDFHGTLKSRREVNKRLYEDECRFIDDLLAPVLRRLARDPRTLVVVTADHGEEFWEHGGYGFYHGKSVYETVVRVPLVISVPSRPPEVAATPASLVDLAPTLLALAGREPPATMQGRPLFTPDGRVAERRRPVFVGGSFSVIRRNEPKRRDAVIVWPRKLILYHKEYWKRGEYYDLAADPGELRPLAEDEFAVQLRETLNKWRRAVRRGRKELYFDGVPRPDLKALGYIQ